MPTHLYYSWPFGPAIAATAADYLGLSIITPALPFYLSDVGVSEATLPRWNGMVMARSSPPSWWATCSRAR